MSFGSRALASSTGVQPTKCISRKMAISCHISSFFDGNLNTLLMISPRHPKTGMEGQMLVASACPSLMPACLWGATVLEETGRMTRDRGSTASHTEDVQRWLVGLYLIMATSKKTSAADISSPLLGPPLSSAAANAVTRVDHTQRLDLHADAELKGQRCSARRIKSVSQSPVIKAVAFPSAQSLECSQHIPAVFDAGEENGNVDE